MSRASILKSLIGALLSTLSYNNVHIGVLESHLASKNSELDVAASKLKSTEQFLRSAENASSLMWEQVVGAQGPQLCDEEAVHFGPERQGQLWSPVFSRLPRQSRLCCLTSRN